MVDIEQIKETVPSPDYISSLITKWVFYGFIAVLIILGLYLCVFLFRQFFSDIRKVRFGPKVFGYRLIYSDQKTDREEEGVIYSEILTSERYGLSGKPDFIFARKGVPMPVELKSGSIGDRGMPHENDLMQLATYFLIVEETCEVRPIKGQLVYKDYTFIIKNTARLREKVVETVANMRRMMDTGMADCEPNFAKCRYCACRGTVCEHSA